MSDKIAFFIPPAEAVESVDQVFDELEDIPKIFFESDNGFERITTIINSMRNFSLSSPADQTELCAIHDRN